MTEVGVYEAKTTLSELIRRVATGEEITITSNGEPVGRLFEVPEDFNDPLFIPG